jgi:hypothetical protein
MIYRFKTVILLFAALTVLPCISAVAQQPVNQPAPVSFTDSINDRITYLKQQVDRFRQNRDVKYLNFQRELDHSLFIKEFHGLVMDENLEQAKQLVQDHIKKSDFTKDLASVNFYRQHEEKIYTLIKDQRMHYQQLFVKDKNFKKEFDAVIEPHTLAAFQKAQRMVNLAIKYASENNLDETVKSLELYESFINALIFDFQSDYDLAVLTNSAKGFEKVFQPLVVTDSLQSMKEAEKLLAHCMNYGKLTGSSLNEEFFKKHQMALTSAISDLLDRMGREQDLARYTDQSVVAKFDSLNPCGVFKWHNQIVVIDEFKPGSSMENVKKGEAIIHADKMLSTYLQKNKLCSSVNDLKFGYAFIIPFQSNAGNTAFFYNSASDKWQFIACYTVIVNKDYTDQISKFMPPLFFEEEMNTAAK